MKPSICLLFGLFIFQNILAQYTVNGNAAQISCNEYRLTDQLNTQSGSVWNNIKINLTQSFDFKFDVFLGSKDPDGADGIVFVLQPISTSVGTTGGGLGYEGVSPAVGITLDTYQNANNNDPAYDHIAIQLNGDIGHNSTNNIAGPVTIINGNDNIEDGTWHSLRIVWDAPTTTLSAYVDGVLRVSAVKNLVNDVFSGNPLVYWGFTGSTGGLNNYQGFKTSLNPHFHLAPAQKRCVNEPITFYDSTISFATIAKFYWDFGDGSPIDSVHLDPVHIYTAYGDYVVIQRVIGADGCEATNTQLVRIGTRPLALMKKNIDSCARYNTYFFDSSYIDFGTINKWFWDLDNAGITSSLQNPVTTYAIGGYKNVRLAVTSSEGCESDTISKIIKIKSATGDFTFTDSLCLGSPSLFFANVNVIPDGTLNWVWLIGGSSYNIQNPVHTFSTSGNQNALFYAVYGYTSPNSGNPPTYCATIIVKNPFVIDKPHAAIKNNSICTSVQIVLADSSYTTDGAGINTWWWDLGNGQFSTLQNPSVTYNVPGPVTVKHVVTSSRGCLSDTVFKTFNVKPSPLTRFSFNDTCKSAIVNFTAADNAGIVSAWKWSFGDGSTANIKDTQHIYTAAGIYHVMLFALAPNGCHNDTLQKDINIYGTNAFAGNDIIAATGRPVQLNASGGLSYTWSPATGLNNSAIANPVATLSRTQLYTVKAFTPAGCETYDDVLVKVYDGPEIYLPNSFNPGIGRNYTYTCTPVYIKSFSYLRIFNRYGQEVFYTKDYTKGWDGTWMGKKQSSGVYVVMASGIDYYGNTIDRKQAIMLIR